MKQKVKWIILFFLNIMFVINCKTTKSKNPSAYDLCMRHPDYIWHEGKCVPRESLLSAKERCLNNEADAEWIDGECVTKETRQSAKQECLSRGDGSSWRVDEKTGYETCFSPAQIVTSEQSCLLQGPNYVWDPKDQICLNPQAQACRSGGDYWTFDGRCVKPIEYECSQKTNGSKFLNGRCVGPNELACMDRGFQRKWVRAEGEDKGSCERKTFMEICSDDKAPSEVVHSLSVIKMSVSRTSCEDTFDILQVVGSLTLDNNELKTLMPLVGFENLKSISLQNNKLKDLHVLSELTQISVLYLSENEIDNLSGIEQLPNLKELYLAENQIYDLKPLGNLAQLKVLYLNKNKINEIGSLLEGKTTSEGLMKLETLDLSDNCNLKDINVLSSLPALKNLYLNRTGVNKDNIPQDFKSRLTYLETSACF